MVRKSFKLFGGLAIKLRDDSKKYTRIQLTSKEKSELFIEGLVTIILLILLNLAMYMILVQIIQTSVSLETFTNKFMPSR